jgi:hypothetical protein
MSGVATPMAGPTVPVEAPAPPPPAIVETAVGIVDLCPDPAAVTKPDWPQVPIAAAPPVQSEPSTASLVLSDGLEDAFAPSRRGARRLGVALAIAAGVLATIVGVSRSVDEAPPASAHSWAATAGPLAVTRIDPRAAADGTANAATASTPTVPTPAVIAALEGRKIRAFDGLFVATAKAAPMRRGAATSHCRNLAIAGLVHWRLPSADEIALLGDAGFVPADSTWWQGGKKIRKPRVEWTGKRVRTQAAKKTAAARTLCVHAVEL